MGLSLRRLVSGHHLERRRRDRADQDGRARRGAASSGRGRLGVCRGILQRARRTRRPSLGLAPGSHRCPRRLLRRLLLGLRGHLQESRAARRCKGSQMRTVVAVWLRRFPRARGRGARSATRSRARARTSVKRRCGSAASPAWSTGFSRSAAAARRSRCWRAGSGPSRHRTSRIPVGGHAGARVPGRVLARGTVPGPVPGGEGWRGSLGSFLESIYLIRVMFAGRGGGGRRWPGMALFWAADAFAGWAGLAAFGYHDERGRVLRRRHRDDVHPAHRAARRRRDPGPVPAADRVVQRAHRWRWRSSGSSPTGRLRCGSRCLPRWPLARHAGDGRAEVPHAEGKAEPPDEPGLRRRA